MTPHEPRGGAAATPPIDSYARPSRLAAPARARSASRALGSTSGRAVPAVSARTPADRAAPVPMRSHRAEGNLEVRTRAFSRSATGARSLRGRRGRGANGWSGRHGRTHVGARAGAVRRNVPNGLREREDGEGMARRTGRARTIPMMSDRPRARRRLRDARSPRTRAHSARRTPSEALRGTAAGGGAARAFPRCAPEHELLGARSCIDDRHLEHFTSRPRASCASIASGRNARSASEPRARVLECASTRDRTLQ